MEKSLQGTDASAVNGSPKGVIERPMTEREPQVEQVAQQGVARRSLRRQIDCSGRDAGRNGPTGGRVAPRGSGGKDSRGSGSAA